MREEAFPTPLLESFHHGGPVPGVQLLRAAEHIAARPPRQYPMRRVRARTFSMLIEAEAPPGAGFKEVTETQIHVAYSRSEGNPQFLNILRQR